MKMLVARWPALVFTISPARTFWRILSRSSKVLSRGFLRWLLPLIVLSQSINIWAQQTDVTLTPNAENAGINKSLEEQIGPGRGDVMRPGSSRFLINRDPFRAIARGRELFQRKFTVSQGFGPRTGDGVGNIGFDPSLGAGLADSCAACHGRPRGSAGFGGQVFTRPDSRDAPHLFGLGIIEMLADQITSELRQSRTRALRKAQRHRTVVTVSLRSKGVDYGQLTAFPDGSTDTSKVEGIDPDLRVKPFFAEGSSFSIREFIVGALNNEMGLEAPDPDLLTASGGGKVVTPTGMVLDGSLDAIPAPPVQGAGDDADGDGIVNEIPTSLVDFLEMYLLNYFKPGTYKQTRFTRLGFRFMKRIQCTACHIPDFVLKPDRRVADVETVYDPKQGKGGFNHLFATARPLLVELDDGSGHPSLKLPAGRSTVIRNIFTDFKRHELGPNFWERNFDGILTKEFMTEPLWGVGSTAPYGHDGRSINLEEVILRHGGEAQASRDAFAALPEILQGAIIRALDSLVLFSPPDTASNLNTGTPEHPDFPQRGHGSIDLSVLFNDPNDKE